MIHTGLKWKKIKGSFEMPKHVLCFFGQQGESFPGRRLTQQRQYSTVSSRHRGRADPPALTTLEKTCFAFWKPVLNNHCCEQMLCWRFSLWDHDSLYENILQDMWLILCFHLSDFLIALVRRWQIWACISSLASFVHSQSVTNVWRFLVPCLFVGSTLLTVCISLRSSNRLEETPHLPIVIEWNFIRRAACRGRPCKC